MLFEGSEKKVEVVIKGHNLRGFGDNYWEEVVKRCNATILSKIESNQLTAYLLSESSLFVWDDRFVMITCGRTVLLKSILSAIEKVGAENIESLIFQRKNEYDSRGQLTSFSQDVDELKKLMPGVALRFGYLDGHHNHLFHLDRPYHPIIGDTTSELLMYHIQGEAAEVLQCHNQDIDKIRSLLKINELFSDFKLDDYLFSPCGYSLNGVKGDDYITIHITPEQGHSYVSFETSLSLDGNRADLLNKVVQLLKPTSFDLITYDIDEPIEFASHYNRVDHVRTHLSCGYLVQFSHFMTEQADFRKPDLI